jgi:hypothetical protein
LNIIVVTGLDDHETSVSIYHEILEAMAVASPAPPAAVLDFNEGDFEKAAYDAHTRFGPVAPETLNTMLQFYGFPTE